MYRFSIDRGGTFCDLYAELPDNTTVVRKLLSVNPYHYADAPTEGIRRVLAEFEPESEQHKYTRSSPIDGGKIGSIRMGTTVATNALLERSGERCGYLTTLGLETLLEIGNQSRSQIFDLTTRKNDQLYEVVMEVEERVMLFNSENDNDRASVENSDSDSNPTPPTPPIKCSTGEYIKILQPLNKTKVKQQLQTILDLGIKAVAVALLHSFIFPQHEIEIGEIARSLGFTQISLSHQVMKKVKLVPRASTTVASAYLSPSIHRYLQSFISGFAADSLASCELLFMRSDGGLTPFDDFGGHQAILSGPAGGVVGYAKSAYRRNTNTNTNTNSTISPVIGFDMGGTSTDVSRYSGSLEHVFESTIADINMATVQLDINTVAAGGGSKLFIKNGIYVVGPESSGAHPGPVCYKKKNGALSVTDANVVLGRVIPAYFPKIFGKSESEALDRAGAEEAFATLLKNSDLGGTNPTIAEVAYGFLKVANEAMCRPIRNLTQMKGFDLTKHVLSAFGGAGPQHCCQIAKNLGMRKIMIHRHGGILSAYGLSLADLVSEVSEPAALRYSKENHKGTGTDLQGTLDGLTAKASLKLHTLGERKVKIECFLNLRYHGTDNAIMTPLISSSKPSNDFWNDYGSAFEENYKREFGFNLLNRDVLVDDFRVRCSVEGERLPDLQPVPSIPPPVPIATERVFFEKGWEPTTPVYKIDELKPGHVVTGPAIIVQAISTIVVELDCIALVTVDGDLEIDVSGSKDDEIVESEAQAEVKNDPVQLSIFGHRFMSIAEQCGKTLARTSVSVNIKERLDFSCALFSATGDLVANAPHIPVHLGAMQAAVTFQTKYWSSEGREEIKEGDVLVSNHPQLAGGSHLPDITVITPVFVNRSIVFFVASRGHHSDIGGLTPGSMPPFSKSLSEEGAIIIAHKLVRNGEFQEDEMKEILKESRNLPDTLSDLRAQVAANRTGINLVLDLISEYSLKIVQSYMVFIQQNAELAVREMLKQFVKRRGSNVASASDHMDDGTLITLKITIDEETGDTVMDFTGTGCQVLGNTNAPPAVTKSAAIYCLRCLVNDDIPLNQGCLNCIDFVIPKFSLLDPSDDAAVVGGNVLTSQRVTDVILRAFNACAASSGCMNNFTFGNESFGYYETICGGSGAGNGWHGRTVHTHMTNTRITDPEILERRYPVLLRKFKQRKGSGGEGKWRGGEGVVREVMPLVDMTMSILSERRVLRPYGLEGGGSGGCGRNTIKKYNSAIVVNVGSKASCELRPGDIITIETPGGGGWGVEGGQERRSGLELELELKAATEGGAKYISSQGSLGEFNYAIQGA